MNLSDSDWVKLNRLLDAALDLEPARRVQWVDSLPAELGTLTDTLRSLLVYGDGLETSDVLLTASPLATTQGPVPERGAAVGPYRLIRELGAGGTATVWLAERADGSLRRQVALKLPRAAWMDRRLAQRLNSERDILASLEHPNIARLYDAGVDATGRPFLALEFVEGIPLDRYVIEHEISIAGRLALFVRAARAVAFAHAHLIVHRDLKPSNILVKHNGDIRLLDFGIARLLQPDQLNELPLMRAEGLALTPQYAAPEQFTGRFITVGTDVYSLGVLLYRLLSGKNPYQLERESLADLEDAVVNRDPLPLTNGMDRKSARIVRGDLEVIVCKAMSKEPADRYETVNAFIDDIERYQGKFPVSARAPRWSYRLGRFVARRKAQVAAPVAVVGALVLGLCVVLWQAHVARTETQRAERIKSFIASTFTRALPRQGAGHIVTASDLLGAAYERIEPELGDSRRDMSELQAIIGSSYLELNEAAKAGPVLQSALSNCEPASRDYEQCRLHAAVMLAGALKITGDHARALRVLDEHLPASVPLSSQMAGDFAVGLRVRAELLGYLNRLGEAESAHLRAVDIAERALGRNDIDTLLALQTLSYHYSMTMQRNKALQAAQEARTRALGSRGHLRPDAWLSSAERTYANALVPLNRSAEAVEVLRGVVADERRLEPNDVRNMVDSEWVLAYALSNLGAFDEAIPLMQRWIEWDKRSNAVDSSQRIEYLTHLSIALGAARRVSEALDTTDRVAEMSARVGDIPATYELRRMLVRARALAQSGEWQQAATLADDALRRSAVTGLETFRLDALAVAAQNAQLQSRSSEAARLAHEIQLAIDLPMLSHIRRTELLSIAAASFLSAGEDEPARAAYERARGEHAKAGVGISVRLADFVIVGARLNLQSADPRGVHELRALAAAWEKMNQNSVWHAESLYWLARMHELSGQGEQAAECLRRALPALRASSLPAMRRLSQYRVSAPDAVPRLRR